MNGYFAGLEEELTAAAGRQRGAPQPSTRVPAARRLRARRRRLAALAFALLAITGVPAAAVTGVFRPHREPDGLIRLSESRVIADGDTPGRGRWQLTASRSDRGFCFGIKLPEAGHVAHSEGCGGSTPGTLSVATSSGGSPPSNAIAFGMAPDRAQRVRVDARGRSVTVPTVDDDARLKGRFYVAELPFRGSIGPTRVTALDRDGAVIARARIG